MNILFVDQFSDLGGAQLCLRDLVPGVKARGWNARAMIPGGGPLTRMFENLGVPVSNIPLGYYSNGTKSVRDALRFATDTPRAALAIREAIRAHRINVLYVNGPRALPAAAFAGCPTVYHAHSVLDKWYARTLAARAVRRSGAAVIAVSRFVADSLANVVPLERIQVVHNGVGDCSRGPRSFDRRPLSIGMIGRIAPEKGQMDFALAASMIRANSPETRFIVVGASAFSDSAYERALRAMPESAHLEFRGWCDDIGAVLAEVDILAVPSAHKDAFPRVVLEAFSAGTPVVTYASGGIPEIIEPGRTGLLTESPTPESLAQSVHFLMEHLEERERISTAARHEWQRRFTAEQYGSAVCEVVYRHCCQNRSELRIRGARVRA